MAMVYVCYIYGNNATKMNIDACGLSYTKNPRYRQDLQVTETLRNFTPDACYTGMYTCLTGLRFRRALAQLSKGLSRFSGVLPQFQLETGSLANETTTLYNHDWCSTSNAIKLRGGW
jgi:hypothetical protein